MVSFQSAIHDDRPTWHNPRILLILLLVFLCGAASGALAARRRPVPVQAKSVAPVWKEGGKTITLNRFRKELNLSDQQAAEIEVTLDEFVLVYQSLQTQMDDFRAYGKQRIMKTLNQDQRVKFEQMMSELQGGVR